MDNGQWTFLVFFRNGTVDFQEFMSMMTEMLRQGGGEEERELDVRQAFKVFDKDGDGLISAEEIRQTMMGLGEEVTKMFGLLSANSSFLSPRFQKQKSGPW